MCESVRERRGILAHSLTHCCLRYSTVRDVIYLSLLECRLVSAFALQQCFAIF